jgi:hypothetical protein
LILTLQSAGVTVVCSHTQRFIDCSKNQFVPLTFLDCFCFSIVVVSFFLLLLFFVGGGQYQDLKSGFAIDRHSITWATTPVFFFFFLL